ncbi:AMP-binding protein [Streptomyces sp. NBC_01429]|uniref:AMP-binding protein n=1 Tax=Streptomyces sp. NBC_01429 TaxID=2903862 RepID=UPI002E2B04CC|nr:AMP-binding protein [Streptomyces sp. NBC_01429]
MNGIDIDNGTGDGVDGSTHDTLPGRFLRGLAKSPDRPAVRSGEVTLTYRRLHERALLLAGSLLAALDTRPPAVGVLAGKGASAYASVLAGLYTGITMVPLQPAFPAARTLRMIEASGVRALIADDDSLPALIALRDLGVDLPVLYAPAGDTTGADTTGADGEGVDGDGVDHKGVEHTATGRLRTVALDPAAALAAPRPVRAEDIAYTLFTSGSTGRPKGVPVTHANTAHYFSLLDARYDFGPDDVFSQNFDLNFDCGMFDLFCAWGAGATLVVPPPQAFRDMPAFVAAHGLTVWFSTPSAIALIRRMGGLRPGSMPSLRWSFFAGEALSCQDAEDWHGAAPGAELENLYGPTELTITISAHRWTGERGLNNMVPIGSVHSGHDVLLLDPPEDSPGGPPAEENATEENAAEESATEGELCIAGRQLTPGYLDPADDTGRFFHRYGRRWYRTGDRVRRTDGGVLQYLGRKDAQVQVHGVRVELAEVDAAVRAGGGVQDAVTVAVPADESVELVVFYTGTPVSAVQLARDARAVLPAAVVPRKYVHLAEFPLNSNRKIDRRKLALQAATTVD